MTKAKDVEIGVLADDNVVLPSYGSHEAAGADLRAHLTEPLTVLPRQI